MSDARELLDAIDNRAMGDITCDPRILDGFEAMLNALRSVLDKCDGLDQTDHPVARAFAREFRDRIADELAGDPDA